MKHPQGLRPTKRYRQLRNADSRRNGLTQGRAHPENTHRSTLYSLSRSYFKIYTCNNNEKRGHEFEEKGKDEYKGARRGRRGKGDDAIIL